MSWIFWILFIIGCIFAAYIGLSIWFAKRDSIKKWAISNQAENIKANHETIFFDTNNIAKENAFTNKVRRLFKSNPWDISVEKERAELRVRNTLGPIIRLNVVGELERNGRYVNRIEGLVSSVGSNEEMVLRASLGEALSSFDRMVGVSGFRFTVKFNSASFYIPDNNPLYYDDDVRDAIGIGRFEKKKTVMEEFINYVETVHGEPKTHILSIKQNIERMDNIAEGDSNMEEKVERFKNKYITLVNESLKAYRQSGETQVSVSDLAETLQIVEKGSGNFLKQLQSKGEIDSHVTKTVIEQQMIADGLINPMENIQENSTRKS